jgi:chromosome segregation protein
VHAAQSELFAANAEVARLEAEIRHRRESQREYETRLAQLTADRRHWQEQAEKLAGDEQRWQDLLALADERVEQGQLRLEARRNACRWPRMACRGAPGGQPSACRDCPGRAAAACRAGESWARAAFLADHRQSARTPGARAPGLPLPDDGELSEKQEELLEMRERSASRSMSRRICSSNCRAIEQERREVLAAVQHAQKERAEANARRNALQQLQQRLQSERQARRLVASAWLAERPGAVEIAARRSRLGRCRRSGSARATRRTAGDAADPAWSTDRPGSKLTLLLPLAAARRALSPAAKRCWPVFAATRRRWSAILADWLGEVLTAPDLAAALARRGDLSASACCVTPGGDLVSRQSVTLFAPDVASTACSSGSARSTAGGGDRRARGGVAQAQAKPRRKSSSACRMPADLQESRQQLGVCCRIRRTPCRWRR